MDKNPSKDIKVWRRLLLRSETPAALLKREDERKGTDWVSDKTTTVKINEANRIGQQTKSP